MSNAPRRDAPPEPTSAFAPPGPDSLAELLRAYLLAKAYREDPWQFALSFDGLRQGGLSETDLRWLVRAGHTEHGLEVTDPTAPRRHFLYPPSLRFSAESCFVLTARGCAYARRDGPAEPANAAVPSWDGQARLCLGGVLVKHFRQPAPAQKKILDSFQEEGWPPWIYNPLTEQGERAAEDRLHDAVAKLNTHQQGPGIHFRLESGCERVAWEPRRNQAALKRHLSGT
jgi:hypothetical protein